jgi:hypothetical protein
VKTRLLMIAAAAIFALAGCGSTTAEKTKEVQAEVQKASSEEKVLTTEELNQKLSEEQGIPVTVADGIATDNPLIEESIKVLNENLKLAKEEKLDEYMNTMLKPIAEDQNNIDSTKSLFANYDIDYALLEIDIQEATQEKVKVFVKQKSVATQVADGYQFSNNIADATHTLVVENGALKLESTEVGEVQPITE